jgi:DNA repair exonuclease SbcCD ATPase subunit
MNKIIDMYEIKMKSFQEEKIKNDLIRIGIENNNKKIATSADELKINQDALQFLEDLANSRRNSMKGKIEAVITEALALVYGPEYSVELMYDIKNNRSFLDIELIKQTANGEIRRNMSGFGGGVSDCISVPLRLLVLLGSKQTGRICILDECYKHVDPERIEFVSKFIQEIAKKLNIQIIICSHHSAMKDSADVVYEISDNNGESVLKEL